MSFAVDPDALEKFGDLMSRYTEDSKAVYDYFQQAEIGGGDTGLFLSLSNTHALALTEAGERMSLMHTIGTTSTVNVRDAAALYRKTDADNAADLDATYPASTYEPLHTEEFMAASDHADEAYAFEDLIEPAAALTGAFTPADLEAKVAGIDTFIHWAGDMLSPVYWVREWVKKITGWDPQEVIDFMVGDWKAIATTSQVWFHCQKAVAGMSHNLYYADDALAKVWSGNAADGAIGFFQKLQVATQSEVDFFTFLSETYAGYVEIAYHASQVLNDLLNALIDELLWPIVLGSQMFTVGPVAAISNQVAKIVSVLTGITDVVRVIEIINAYADLPDKMPDSLMWQLGVSGDPNAGYHHPGLEGY